MPGMQRLQHLDGWRGVAVLLVLLMHFYPRTELDYGAFGVDMFFVLSGRLLAEMLFGRGTRVPLFLKRRVSRIVPALLFFTCGTVALQAVLVALGIELTNYVSLPDFIVGNLFLENYAFGFGLAQTFHHLWSLAVEEHCYLLIALMAVLSAGRAMEAAWLAIALAVFAFSNGLIQEHLFGLDGYTVYWRTDVRGAGLMLAFGLSLVVREHWTTDRLPRLAPLVSPAAFMLAVLCALYPLPETMRWGVAPLLLALSMATFDIAAGWWKRPFTFRPLIWAGMVSYSVYLWQQPFYANKPLLSAELALACGVGFGLASFFLVEQPARRWLNRTWATDRAPALRPKTA
jgi:peptidoglycan/LPS O-acetylase OafA/YrhL